MDGSETSGSQQANPSAGTGAPGVAGAGQDAPPPLPGLLARIPVLLFEPSKLFRALRAKPAILGALLLAAVLVALSSSLIPIELVQEDAQRRVAEMQETMRARGVEIPEGAQGSREVNAQGSKIIMIAAPLIAIPLGLVVISGIFSLIFRNMMQYQGSYRQYLSVIAHSYLVMAFGTLLIVPLQVSAGRLDLTLSVGALLPFLGEGFLARFLQGVNLFSLWTAILIGTGIAVIDGNRRASGPIGVIVGIMLVFAALRAITQGLFGT